MHVVSGLDMRGRVYPNALFCQESPCNPTKTQPGHPMHWAMQAYPLPAYPLFLLRSLTMNKRQFLSTAAASMLAMGVLVATPAAHADSMSKCFGVATAGHNDCAGLSGLHSCKGTAT
ncbi:MAG: DUF2282 domain-containing protein, partial [Thiomonas sp.]